MATKEKVVLKRSVVVRLLAFVGWKTIDKWDNKRMAEKLPQIPGLIQDGRRPDEKDEELCNALLEVEAGAEGKAEFEVVDDVEETDDSDYGVNPPQEVESAETESEEDTVEKKPAKPAKAEKPAKAPKAEKPAKPAKVEKPEKPEKAPRMGRSFVSGQVIAKHGVDKGVTDEMVSEADALYGKGENPKEAKAWLVSSLHAVKGYLAGEAEAK